MLNNLSNLSIGFEPIFNVFNSLKLLFNLLIVRYFLNWLNIFINISNAYNHQLIAFIKSCIYSIQHRQKIPKTIPHLDKLHLYKNFHSSRNNLHAWSHYLSRNLTFYKIFLIVCELFYTVFKFAEFKVIAINLSLSKFKIILMQKLKIFTT